jgi:transposase
MQLVERHVIKRADARYASIDAAAFASKNLYNAANYIVRQSFITEGVYLNYRDMDRRMQGHEAYKAPPAKVAQWVLRLLEKHWQSYFAARAAWQTDSSTFLGRPRLPGYKGKQMDRNLVIYTIQAPSVPALWQGLICPSILGITVKTKQQNIQQVRIIPRIGFDIVEVVYEREPVPAAVTPALHAGVDIGLNNQEVNLDRRTNQNFVSVPHARFIEMLTYKAQLVGIQVIVTEENYTSKASFLDGDLAPIYDAQRQETPLFSGRRVKRGLYRARDGRRSHADASGVHNIMRKGAPDACARGRRGCVVHPVRLVV